MANIHGPFRPFTARLTHSLLLVVFILLSTLTMTWRTTAQQRERCFTEPEAPNDNGQPFCVQDPILAYWEQNGGLPVFGYPTSHLSEETIEGTWSGPVQWFERDRLEDHTADGEGVLAGRLGARILEMQGQPWETFEQVADAPPGCRYFAETRHSLCEPFKGYWEQHGGLMRFGYPITEPFQSTIEDWTGTIQYFERRRMEHHTEFRGTPYEVLLGLLGNEVRGVGLAPTPVPISGCSSGEIVPVVNAAYEQEVVELTNAIRTQHGLSPLRHSTRLDNAARYHATDMGQDDYFDHDTFDRVNGQLVWACNTWDRLSAYYHHMGAAENIARGQRTPSEVVDRWMNSSGHRKNILNPDLSEIGVGYYGNSATGGRYWVQNFGNPGDDHPDLQPDPSESPSPTPTLLTEEDDEEVDPIPSATPTATVEPASATATATGAPSPTPTLLTEEDDEEVDPIPSATPPAELPSATPPADTVAQPEPGVCLTAADAELSNLINQYRREHGLPDVPISRSLVHVAQAHVIDLHENEPDSGTDSRGLRCNMHSWSGNGPWSAVCYTDDHEYAEGMWVKPQEITNGAYAGNGYEISHGASGMVTPAGALEGWQGSPPHNAVIVEENDWGPWQAMGAAVYEHHAVVWFGKEPDPQGTIELCP